MADEKTNLKEKLQKIQVELKAPKNLHNSFGDFNYRNAEGILEAVKPFENKYKVAFRISDDVVGVLDRVYVKAVASILDVESDEEICSVGWARETLTKKGMDDAQITGAASSYARKYALSGLLLLDDTKDADSDEYSKPDFSKYDNLTPRQALLSLFVDFGLDGKAICQTCGINNSSTDKDFKEAIEYTKGLITG